ncbi:MAG: thioredoxin [Phycisphaerales bacterium]
MSSANFLEFTDANFDAEVLASDKPVLVDFTAKWCGPCRQLQPTIEQIAEECVGTAKVGKLDTETSRQVCVKYGIATLPTLMIFRNGNVVKKWMGMQKKDTIVNALLEATKV